MKTLKSLLTLALVAGFATVGFGQSIVGSDHDFSGDSWNLTGEICITCHTPHNADNSTSDAPLWNHELSSEAAYTLYTSSTLTTTAVGQPDASSKLCLSCHDGTVGLGNFGGRTHAATIGGGDLIGTDLSDDHPVSFDYDAALATSDGALYDPTTQTSGLNGTIDDDLLIGSKMQCASCHDVHNSSGVDNLLVKSNAASALCLTCHIK